MVFHSDFSLTGACSRRSCFARQRRSPLTRTKRSPPGAGRKRTGLSGCLVPRLAMLAASSSILRIDPLPRLVGVRLDLVELDFDEHTALRDLGQWSAPDGCSPQDEIVDGVC